MLNKIVEIITKNKSSVTIEDDLLLCKYLINDINFLNSLYDNNLIANSVIDDYKENDTIVLEFLISSLRPKGFYLTKESFLQWNYYNIPTNNVYIHQINNFLSNDSLFNEQYSTIVELIRGLEKSSKWLHKEIEILQLLIIQEDKSLPLYLQYFIKDLETIDDIKLKSLKNFIDILNEDITPDRKNIYINEMIDFLVLIDEKDRFSYFIQKFDDFIHRASASYNFYLRNFSYNKLKMELDTKALEYYQKLQGIVNDSQTKLVAIPTALIFAFSTLNYDSVNDLKNYLIILGLIIFCLFIQIFINNQKSALKFIEENIEYYKNTHKDNQEELNKSFCKVDSERDKQNTRLQYIQILLWLTLILPIFVVLVINYYKTILIFFRMYFTNIK
ncbi:hypothetical protein ACFFUE_03115 [Bergeyella porcorum]|uniref:hypothetical protein n=1 Tax=Bergeyella porcorum TaxID=1735111 RepID=UPI0035EF44FC